MVGSIFFAAILAVAGPEVQVGTVDGVTHKGSLQRLSVDKLTLATPEGDVSLPLEQLLTVTAVARLPDVKDVEAQMAWIELVDGSRIGATELTIKDGQASLASGSRTDQIPVAVIRSIRFSKPDETANSWPAEIADEPATDLLAVRKKDSVDFMEGAIEGVTSEHVLFKVDGETIPVKRAKVDGFILAHKAADKLPDAVAVVQDGAGWKLRAKAVLLDEGTLKVITPSGEEFTRPISGVTEIDFASGRIAYLSDLEPDSVQWTPFLDTGNTPKAIAQYYAPRRDDGREHQPIRVGGKVYAKGMSLYSRTQLVYRLPAGMKKFQATAGIDDSVRDAGNVVLQISADGKRLFDQSIAGKDAPVDINLDIAGAKRLIILVDFGNDGDAGDYLNLADARMLK